MQTGELQYYVLNCCKSGNNLARTCTLNIKHLCKRELNKICLMGFRVWIFVIHYKFFETLHVKTRVPMGSPSRGGDVTVYVKDINQPSLPTPFILFLCLFPSLSVSVFMALSTVFHSINSPDNSPFSHSVLPLSSLLYWSFELYISL